MLYFYFNQFLLIFRPSMWAENLLSPCFFTNTGQLYPINLTGLFFYSVYSFLLFLITRQTTFSKIYNVLVQVVFLLQVINL